MTTPISPPDFETFVIDDKQMQEYLELLLKKGIKVKYLIAGHGDKVKILHNLDINVLKKNSKVRQGQKRASIKSMCL